jgi:acyl-CoA synthetase (AMP-forming)/AMP-acid ligase II
VAFGGSPSADELQRRIAETFPNVRSTSNAYGLTETSSVATVISGADGRRKPQSVGPPVPGVDVRIVDPTNRPVAVGETGEVCIRGPILMKGYWNKPEATAEAIDADGWLKTGDLGYVDGEGNVFVVDRLKELIKVSAYGVAPAELEAVLLTHPNVADAAVVGRPDEERGEVPVAAVVPRGDLDADGLMDWVAEKVAPHKKIGDVRFVDAIPKTPSGKLLRRVLVEQERRGLSVLKTPT